MSVLPLLLINLLLFVSQVKGQEEENKPPPPTTPPPNNPLAIITITINGTGNSTNETELDNTFRDEFLERLQNASDLVNNEDVKDYLLKIEAIFGHPEDGVINSSSYFGVISRAYFGNVPFYWPIDRGDFHYARLLVEGNTQKLRYAIIAYIRKYEKLEKFIEKCNQTFMEATEELIDQNLLERVHNCAEDEEINTLVADNPGQGEFSFLEKFLQAAVYATNMLMTWMQATLNDWVFADESEFYKPTLFLILEETTKLDKQMEANFARLKAEKGTDAKKNDYVKLLEKRLNRDKKGDGKKDILYRVVERNNESLFDERNKTLNDMLYIMENHVSTEEWVCLQDTYTTYVNKEDPEKCLEEYKTVSGDLDYDLTKALLYKYHNLTIEFYYKYYHVEQNGEYSWNFTVDNPNAKELNVIHGMRMAWELLDEVNEDLLVLLNETYFSYRREAALKDAHRRFKENKKLFTDISYTYGRFCARGYNETGKFDDLIGSCNVENNEICTERKVLAEEWPIPPKDDSIAGLSPLKPKRIKVMNPLTREFETRLVYVIKYRTCRCGFRLDCGDEFGEKIYCVLQANDAEYRKQCRGTQGYPCKTLPLAKGRHHESCLTGYCDMEGDSCEDGPPVRYVDLESRAGHRMMNTDKIAIYAGFTALICNFML